MSTKTVRSLRLLLNEIYLTYAMTHKLPNSLMDKVAKEVDNAEPCVVMHPSLGNDIQLRPEPEANRCVHTEHCCKLHGCKYGDDGCPVESGSKGQSYICESCYNEHHDNE